MMSYKCCIDNYHYQQLRLQYYFKGSRHLLWRCYTCCATVFIFTIAIIVFTVMMSDAVRNLSIRLKAFVSVDFLMLKIQEEKETTQGGKSGKVMGRENRARGCLSRRRLLIYLKVVVYFSLLQTIHNERVSKLSVPKVLKLKFCIQSIECRALEPFCAW